MATATQTSDQAQPTDPTKSNDVNDSKDEWNDVTSILDSITSGMDLGCMIHAKDFSLHSSMSALEIGDGVLDAGMKHRILNIEDVLNDKNKLNKMFNIESNYGTYLGVLDDLLRCLYSFFNGNGDSYSLYICLLLHKSIRNHVDNVNNSNIYLFIDSILLCSGYARELVLESNINKDEDWNKDINYKFDNFNNLNQITKDLQNKINELKNYKNDDNDNDNDDNNDQNDEKLLENSDNSNNKMYSKSEYIQALSYRFEFVAALLNILADMYNASKMFKDVDITKKKILNNNKSVKNVKKQASKQKSSHNNKKKNKSSKNKSNKAQKGGKGKKKGSNKPNKAQKGKKKGNTNTNKQKDDKINKIKSNKYDDIYLIDLNPISQCKLSQSLTNKHRSIISSFKSLSSGLLRIVNNLSSTYLMGDPSSSLEYIFDVRISYNKSVHCPRTQRIPSKKDAFQLFNEWCKTLRYISLITSINPDFDSFITYLNKLNCLKIISYKNLNKNQATDFQSKSSSFSFPSIILRSFLIIIIEQFITYSSFLWSSKPIIHFIQKSFRDNCEWCKIHGSQSKSQSQSQLISDYYTFYNRIETALKDVLKQKLIHITSQLNWTKRILKNWYILQAESPEIDKLTILSYLKQFADKYHSTIKQHNDYRPKDNSHSLWVCNQTVNTMIYYLNIGLSDNIHLYSVYEIENILFYFQYLYKTKLKLLIESYNHRYQKVDINKLEEIINPNYAKIKQRKLDKDAKKYKNNKKYAKNYLNKQKLNEINYKLLPKIDQNDKYYFVINSANFYLYSASFELIQLFYKINVFCNQLNIIIKWDGLNDRSGFIGYNMSDNVYNNMLGDPSLRYNHRFNIFNYVRQPIYIDYNQYVTKCIEYANKYPAIDDMFNKCMKSFSDAKKYFVLCQQDKFKNVSNLDIDYIQKACKIAIANKLFVTNLIKIIQTQTQNQNQINKSKEIINIKTNFDQHPYFISFAMDQTTK